VNQIKPKVQSSGMYLELRWMVHEAFFSEKHLTLATKENSKKKQVKKSYYKASALALAACVIKSNFNFEDVVCVQCIKLPFKVEQDFCTDNGPGSELQLFGNDDGEMDTLGMGYLILTVELVSTEKPPKKS